jgi:hypothetical protein
MSENQKTASYVLGIAFILAFIFIGLKLYNVIEWTWLQIFPLIHIGISFVFIVLIVIGYIKAITEELKDLKTPPNP